jgi:hypothetical protein
MRRLIALVATGLLVAASAPAALAGAPTPVDPLTLTPPPNPNFTWTCLAYPTGIECTGVEPSSGVDVNPDPSFSCDGHPILVTYTQMVTGRRWHDAEGRVTHSHFVGTFDEHWRLDGSDGPLLTSRGRWTERFTYPIPGDVTSRTPVFTGTTLAVSAPGQGVIFQNTGRVVFNWDESEVLALAGPQAMIEDFDGAIEAVCAAFGV